MKNQSKIRLIALVMAVCASLTACGNAADDNMDIVQYTEGKQQEQTTKYDSIYDSMDDVQQTGTASDASYVKISEFEKASNFNEGHAIVTYGGKHYIIDTTGNIVLEFTDAPKEYTIYNGGFIILENENVMNIKGEIVADTAVHGHDMVRGIWHSYIVLRKEVDTIERTGYDYCILNSDGSVHVDWAPNPYYKYDESADFNNAAVLETDNDYIKVKQDTTFRPVYGIYNLENGKYYDNSSNVYRDMGYYDYGYVVYEQGNVCIYDYNDNLIETFNTLLGTDTPFSSLDDDIIWLYEDKEKGLLLGGNSNVRAKTTTFYDARLRKYVTFPFSADNVEKLTMLKQNRQENLYIGKVLTKDASAFCFVVDENSNYVVEAIKDEILTCSNGVYTTENGMYKTDGTLIFEGNSFGQFTDGYCCMNENSYIDINGNKLEVEFKTE